MITAEKHAISALGSIVWCRKESSNMARAQRHFLPGYLSHIAHRCHKRELLFKFSRYRDRYLLHLHRAKKELGLSVLNYMIAATTGLRSSARKGIAAMDTPNRISSMCMRFILRERNHLSAFSSVVSGRSSSHRDWPIISWSTMRSFRWAASTLNPRMLP